MEAKVGDKVRVRYHPANPQRSFAEGVVSRVDVSTLRGSVFVIDVTDEVVLDRVLPIRPGYQNYVLYERIDEFPGRIEVLSAMEPAFEREPEGQHEAAPHERQVETEPATEQAKADEEPAPDRDRGLQPPQPQVPEFPTAPIPERQETSKEGSPSSALFGKRNTALPAEPKEAHWGLASTEPSVAEGPKTALSRNSGPRLSYSSAPS